ncbi:MAG: hypothetical protein II822_06790, partial [Prevotella sp.]|nr:hypothetical protein [Prevotella sp.]
ITRQQFAVSCVKLIMQASGDTAKDDMSDDARLTFTSKAKELIKSKTGTAATDSDNDNGGSGNSNSGTGNSDSGNSGGSSNSGSGDGGDDGYGI